MVDGFDDLSRVIIRDPWGPSTRYFMEWTELLDA